MSRNAAALPTEVGGGDQWCREGVLDYLPSKTDLSPYGWGGVLPWFLPCNYPLLPKASARGGSPYEMRSSPSVAAQSPGQGIQ